jgi:hypothetical protein
MAPPHDADLWDIGDALFFAIVIAVAVASAVGLWPLLFPMKHREPDE